MKSLTALVSMILLTQSLVVPVTVYAGLTKSTEDDVIEIDPALVKKMEALDKRIEQQKADAETYSAQVTNLKSQVSDKERLKSYVTGLFRLNGNRKRSEFKCEDYDHYKAAHAECTTRLYNGINYYESDSCIIYRWCIGQYKKYKVSDATIEALRTKLQDAATNRDDSNEELQALRDQREGLNKSNGRELRVPEDISELRGQKAVNFEGGLSLNVASGSAVKMADDCIFTITPLRAEEEKTGGYNVSPGTNWKFEFMSPDLVDFTVDDFKPAQAEVRDENERTKLGKELALKACTSSGKVHISRKRECEIDMQWKGSYIQQPSVILYDAKSEKFMRVEPTSEGKTSKDVLACLTKRGFKPDKVLAKIKPTEPAQGGVASEGSMSVLGATKR